MAKLNLLTDKAVKAAKKDGRLADGGGLFLAVSGGGAGKSWLFMWARGSGKGKKRFSLGLGSTNVVSLAEAREKASACRKAVFEGRDPRALFKRDKSNRKIPTFAEVADALLASKEGGWRNEKHKAQWRMTLETYAAPLRSKPVDEIDTAAVLEVLKPLWQAKPETASRLRGRIEAVLDAAKAQGHRSGDNPAEWKGNLAHLLPKRQKLSRGHHAALPYPQLPAFVARLRDRDGAAARALEFTILTAARSGEVIGARIGEIDLEAKTWTVPAVRMKAAREHRIPLTERAVELAREASDGKEAGALLWPLSNAAMSAVLRRMDVEVTVHGFRSSFRDWAGETTAHPREVIEHALAHQIPDKAEAAYARGTLFEKRRALMENWGNWVDPGPTILASVTSLR